MDLHLYRVIKYISSSMKGGGVIICCQVIPIFPISVKVMPILVEIFPIFIIFWSSTILTFSKSASGVFVARYGFHTRLSSMLRHSSFIYLLKMRLGRRHSNPVWNDDAKVNYNPALLTEHSLPIVHIFFFYFHNIFCFFLVFCNRIF